MRFTIPQFIERESPIVGPLTFKQFIIVGIGGGIILLLYFSIAKTRFFLFFILSIIIIGTSLLLAFFKIGGRNLPAVLISFLMFKISPKTYLWRKKETPIKVLKKEKVSLVKNEEEEKLPLKIAEKSQLKKMRTEIETKTK